jgi:hypothetical protein
MASDMSLLAHGIWAAVVLASVFRVCKVALAFAPHRATATATAYDEIDVPEDLVAYAMQEREAWAQEEVLRAVRERFEELRDWNKVRSAVGIGRIDG